jgi:hypothetical protein
MFDLIVGMLTLDEMDPETREAVLREIKLVLKLNGRGLLVDFHPGSYQPLQRWIGRLIVAASELAAGKMYFRNDQTFLAEGGLRRLLTKQPRNGRNSSWRLAPSLFGFRVGSNGNDCSSERGHRRGGFSKLH